MKSSNGTVLIILITVSATAMSYGQTTPPASELQSPLIAGPTSLKARIDKVLVRIDGPKLWTLSRIEFDGALLGIEDSAYGTVIGIRDVGFIGTAHREVEPEEVIHLQFIIDGEPVETTSGEMEASGNDFRMERRSRIRAFNLRSILRVKDNEVFEAVRITTDQPVNLKAMYPLMYAWTPDATQYLFGADDGREIAGDFIPETVKPHRYIIEQGLRWAAVYDLTTRKGTVSRLLAQPGNEGAQFQFADAPNVYRKLYLMCFAEGTVPAGFDGTYAIVTGFISADEESWKDAARERADELSRASSELLEMTMQLSRE